METIGFVGVGKIGLPISENLIKSGYRVLGYRRGSLADFEKLGGVPAKSPAEIGAQCDIVFSCVPTAEAMDEVVNGPQGLIHSARPGQIIVELGSHPVPDKEKHVATARQEGRGLSRRRGQRHARHGGGAQGRDLSRRRRRGRQEGRAGDQGLRRPVPLFRAVRRRDQGQARQQPAGRHQHRGHRRGDGAGAEGRRRRRPDDQGDRQRQRRLDPVRHPRAVDGAAQVPAGAGPGGAAVSLLPHDRAMGRRDRHRDAAARPRHRALPEVHRHGAWRQTTTSRS